jgi:hypothetical protein
LATGRRWLRTVSLQRGLGKEVKALSSSDKRIIQAKLLLRDVAVICVLVGLALFCHKVRFNSDLYDAVMNTLYLGSE